MNIPELGHCPNADPVLEEIRRLDLSENALDLAVYGVTVVPPEKTGLCATFVSRLRDATLEVAARRNGIDLSGDYRTLRVDPQTMTIGNHWHILYEDDVFAETALNPVGLALARYLCGNSVTLGLDGYFVKPADCVAAMAVPLHVDFSNTMGDQSAPGCNVAILCTDYEDDSEGPTVFVPGSHRFARPPFEHEEVVETCPFPIMPLRGKAGSIVAWHGLTWHGSLPRTKPGLRIHTINMYYRRHMRPAHDWNEPETDSLLARHPGLDRVLGKGNFAHGYPRKETVSEEIADFLHLSRDPYA